MGCKFYLELNSLERHTLCLYYVSRHSSTPYFSRVTHLDCWRGFPL